MRYSSKKLPILAAISVVLAGTAVVGSANIEPNSARSKSRETGVSVLTPEQIKLQEAMIVSDAGRTTISYIRTARRLLHNQQTEQAGQYLAKAKYLLGQISELARYYATDDKGITPYDSESITTLKSNGETSAMVSKVDAQNEHAALNSEKFLPIFGAIKIDQHVQITGELKSKLNALSRNLVRGEHAQVIAGLKQAGIATSYTYVDMPYEGTVAKVDNAIDSLGHNNVGAADQAMLSIERALHIDKVSLGQADSTHKS